MLNSNQVRIILTHRINWIRTRVDQSNYPVPWISYKTDPVQASSAACEFGGSSVNTCRTDKEQLFCDLISQSVSAVE